MKKILLVLVVVSTFFGLNVKDTEEIAFGITDDSYNVTSLGAYNHIIPIQVTPGVNGLQPNLALVYDSNSGAGDLGIGWSLSGLSRISRAGNNFAQNGKELSVQFTNEDTFLLDGQYLTCVSGTNGRYDSEYRTENETFNKIYAKASTDKSKSPQYFVVKKPNGKKYIYGKAPGSKLELKINGKPESLEWMISQIIDEYGNRIDFEYTNNENNPTVEGIRYFNAKNTEIGSVVFRYELDSNEIKKKKVNVQIIRGNLIGNEKILKRIECKSFRNLGKTYELFYNEDYSKLKELKEYTTSDDDEKKYLKPIKFEYYNNDSLTFNNQKKYYKPHLNSKNLKIKTFSEDLNLDGTSEHIVFEIVSKNLKLTRYLNDGTGKYLKKDSLSLDIADYKTSDNLRIIGFTDFNDDNYQDLFTVNGVYLNNKSKTSIPFDFDERIYISENTKEDLGDLGILIPVKFNSKTKNVLIGLNKKGKVLSPNSHKVFEYNEKTKQFEQSIIFPKNTIFTDYEKSDNTNGQTIFSLIDNRTGKPFNIYQVTFDDDKFKRLDKKGFNFLPYNYKEKWKWEDINLDGKKERVSLRSGSGKKLMVNFPSWASGNTTNITSHSIKESNDVIENQLNIQFGNFLNSGFKEIFVPIDKSKFKIYAIKTQASDYSIFNNGVANYYNEDPFELKIEELLDSNRFVLPSEIDLIEDDYTFSDLNGDGLTDIILNLNEDGILKPNQIEFINPLTFVNRLSRVIDGFDNYVEINYSTTKNQKVYTNNFEINGSDYLPVFGPFVVVENIEYSNGLKAQPTYKSPMPNGEERNRIEYSYNNLIIETKGRGLAGFQNFSTTNIPTGTSMIKSFEYKFPLTGKINKEVRLDSLGNEYYRQENKWVIKEFKKTNKKFKVDNLSNIDNSRLINIEKFNTTGIRYIGLLENATIINKEKNALSGSYDIKTKSTISYEYDDYGNVINQTTQIGNKSISKRAEYQNIASKNTPDAIYKLGLLSKEINFITKDEEVSEYRVFKYEYNDLGNLKNKIREPDNLNYKHTTSYLYDNYGNLKFKKVTAKDLITSEKYQYDNDGRFLISTENVYGHKTTFRYNEFYGSVIEKRDINNNSTINDYDSFGNIIKTILPSKEVVNFSYSYDNNFASKSGINNFCYQIETNSNLSKPIRSFYDKKGREIGSISYGIDTTAYANVRDEVTGGLKKELNDEEYIARLIVNRIRYDNNGNILTVQKPQYNQFLFGSEDKIISVTPEKSDSYFTSYSYDQFNRLISSKLPDGNKLHTQYYVDHKIEFDPKGNKKITYFNELGEISKTEDQYGKFVKFEYDLWGNVTSIRSDNSVVNTKYDHLGRKTQTDDAYIGTIKYTYDSFDRIKTEDNNNLYLVEIEYDSLSRIVRKKTKENTIKWIYNNNDSSNYIGGPFSIQTSDVDDENDNIYESFHYDKLGNIIKSDIVLSGKTYSTSFQYDNYSRLKQKFFPSNSTTKSPYSLKYNYKNNIAAEIYEVKTTGDDSEEKLIYEIESIDAMGKVLRQQYGNGALTNFKYDRSNDQLLGIKSNIMKPNTNYVFGDTTPDSKSVPFVSNTLQDISLSYDSNYNLKTQKNKLNSTSSSYTYDRINRLDDYTINDKYTDIEYDQSGNIIKKDDVGTFAYEIDNKRNQLSSITKGGLLKHQFKYDTLGNVTEEIRGVSDTIRIDYNSYNKPFKLTKGEDVQIFKYGSSNREVYNKLTINSVTKKERIKPYSDFEIIKENNKTTYVYYILLNGNLIASHNISENNIESNQYYFKDHLGSIELITDDTGLPIKRYKYDPFGKRSEVELSTPNSLSNFTIIRGFTGHEHLDDFGYINAKGRFYNPTIGRFLSADPFIQSPLNLQSLNRYSYVLNNPLNLVDPSGFFFKKIFKSVSRSLKSAWNAISNIGRQAVEFHKNIWKEAERAVEKYGKQLIVIAVAAAITYFSAGTLAGFGAAMLTGAAWGAGIAASITAIKGGSLSEIIDAGFNGAIAGATAAAAAYAIGTGFDENGISTSFGDSGYYAKGLSHGTSGGIQAEINGGDFKNGFFSASISYAFTPLNEQAFGTPAQNPENALQRITFSSAVGATASYVSGGNVMEGALTAGFIQSFNHESHPKLKQCTPPKRHIPVWREDPVTVFERAYHKGASDALKYIYQKSDFLRPTSTKIQTKIIRYNNYSNDKIPSSL